MRMQVSLGLILNRIALGCLKTLRTTAIVSEMNQLRQKIKIKNALFSFGCWCFNFYDPWYYSKKPEYLCPGRVGLTGKKPKTKMERPTIWIATPAMVKSVSFEHVSSHGILRTLNLYDELELRMLPRGSYNEKLSKGAINYDTIETNPKILDQIESGTRDTLTL